MQLLTDAERAQLPDILPDWRPVEGQDALERGFKFKDFSAAWGFMARVALLAERHDHHPDWSNTYNRVNVRLSTHDAAGLTQRDVRLAQAIDLVAG